MTKPLDSHFSETCLPDKFSTTHSCRRFGATDIRDRLRPYTREHPCDLCGHNQFVLVGERDRRKNLLETVVCRKCGLVAHAELPTDAQLDEYYERQYRQEYHGEYTPSPHRVVREWNRGRHLLQLLTPFVEPSDRIVEVGCGMGCTVKNFHSAGYDASGIEPGEGFQRFAAEQLRAPVRAGVLASVPAEPNYDVVLLVHVLEHLRSPTDAMTHLRSMLRPRGRVYVEVPNAGAPHAAPGKMFHFAHIYNFTRDTLQMLAEKAQFRVECWLSPPGAKNLAALLTGTSDRSWSVDPKSFPRTIRSLTQLNTISYHLRWRYIRERARSLIGHRYDHFRAARRVEQILERCQFGEKRRRRRAVWKEAFASWL